MSKPTTTPSHLTNQSEDDLIAPLPRVLQGGLLKMGVAPTPSVTPVLLSATPADNTGAVGVSNDIVLHFNTAVQAGSGNIVISDGHTQSYIDGSGALANRIVGATDTRSLSLSDPQVSIVGTDVTIRLSTPLKAGTGYSVTMAAGVLTDTSASHVSYAGLANTSVLNFTTSAAHAAPTAVIGATIHFEDTGSSSTDYITNSAAQTLQGTYSGTLQAGDFVQVSLDNGASWNLVNNAGSNAWSYSGSSISASSTMLARISNIYGLNSGTASQAYTYISSAPPSATVNNDFTFSADTGISATDLITSTAAQTISGTYCGTLAAGETVQVSTDGGGTWFSASANNSTQTWSYSGATLTPGNQTVMARIINDFNSYSTPASHSYILDTTPPGVTLTGVTLALDSGSDTGAHGDGVTSSPKPDIAIGGLLPLSPAMGDVLEIIDTNHGSAVVGYYEITSGDLQYGSYGHMTSDIRLARLDDNLADGTHILQVQLSDKAGNATAPASAQFTLTIDRTAPTASMANATLHLATNNDTGASATDRLINQQLPTITVDLSGVTGMHAGEVIQIVDNVSTVVGSYTLQASDLDGAGAMQTPLKDITLTQALSASTHTLHVQLSDIAGNAGAIISSTSLQVTVDLLAPTLQSIIPADVSGVVSAANPGDIVLTFNEDVYLQHTASVLISDGISAHDLTLTVEGFDISVVGHTITMHLPDTLVPSQSNYTATLSGADIIDLAGNVVIASNATFLHFSTDNTVPATPQIVAAGTVAFSNGSNVTVSGSYTTTSISANDIISVTLDQGATWTAAQSNFLSSPGNGIWSVAIPTLNGAIGVRIENAQHTVSHPAIGFEDYGAVPIYFMPSGGGSFTKTSDDTLVYGGTGNDIITVGNEAYVDGGGGVDTIVAGNHSYVLAGDHATVTLGSGSTVEATGDFLTLNTSSNGHSIIMNTLIGLTTAHVTATGASDTLDIYFYGNTFNLHAVAGANQLSGIETIYLGAGGNTITVDAASDVTAFAGGNTLAIQSAVGGNEVHVNMGIWQLDSTDSQYRTYHAIADSTIALLVGINISNGAA